MIAMLHLFQHRLTSPHKFKEDLFYSSMGFSSWGETQKRQVMDWTVVPVVSVDLRTSPGPSPLLPPLSIQDSPHLSIWAFMVAGLVAWLHPSFLGVRILRPQLLQKSNTKSYVYHLGSTAFSPAPTMWEQHKCLMDEFMMYYEQWLLEQPLYQLADCQNEIMLTVCNWYGGSIYTI